MRICVTPHADYRIGIASGVCGYYGGGDENPMIRADMIYYKTPGDSAVVRRAAE